MASVIDPRMWASLKALEAAAEPGFLRSVVAQFLETSPGRLRAIHEAASTKDWGALEREAHTLKGSASILGATRLAEHCERLEAHGRERRPLGQETTLLALQREWEAARVELLELEKQGR